MSEVLTEQKGRQRNVDLLFYQEYESFYAMAKESEAFRAFCADAFGADFSQDGFSDIRQVNRIIPYITKGDATEVLDIGCGNGKMLRYLQAQTGCRISGFDYSHQAIETAKTYPGGRGDFREGVIGEIEYPSGTFDVIVSMDTMYFAPDMTAFVGQIQNWLKKDGTFFVAYQEGDVVEKTENAYTTLLALALKQNGLDFAVTDITRETYEMLQKKRQSALKFREKFIAEGNEEWLDMLLGQTECVLDGFDAFAQNNARYIYVVKKG